MTFIGRGCLREKKKGKKEEKGREGHEGRPPPSQREGEAVRRVGREIAVTRRLGRASEGRAKCGKGGR